MLARADCISPLSALTFVVCFSSDEGFSLRAEGSADAGAPLSLDSAIQERLQQERASLQSQMELLEKRKNEEIQNLKTSLIAEQQVCVRAVNRREQ